MSRVYLKSLLSRGRFKEEAMIMLLITSYDKNLTRRLQPRIIMPKKNVHTIIIGCKMNDKI